MYIKISNKHAPRKLNITKNNRNKTPKQKEKMLEKIEFAILIHQYIEE